METALKFKIKQRKNCTITHKIFPSAKELHVLLVSTNDCSRKVSQYIAVCVVHSSLLAWISSLHIDKVLAWMSSKNIHVLGKNLLQIMDINCLPTIS